MALSTAARNAAVDAFTALINTGGAGSVQFGDSSFANIYLSYSFDATAFAAASGGTATANGFPKNATGAGSGTNSATHYRILDGASTEVDSRALASAISVTSGETYTANSITYSQPAS